MKKLWKWLMGRRPVLRKTMDDAVAERLREIGSLQKRLADEKDARTRDRRYLAEERDKAEAKADAVIERIAKIDFRHGRMEEYLLTISFDARAMYGGPPQDELHFLAERIGHQVSREIASSKFVQKAREAEYKDRADNYARYFPKDNS